MPPAIADKKKKKRIKKKKKTNDDDFHTESAGIVQKLKQRYNNNKKIDGEIIKDPIIKSGKLIHPTRYISLIERGQKAQLSRLIAPDPPENVLQTKWICALCQRYSCSDNLGDLFGPYFIDIDSKKFLPEFLLAEGVSIPPNGKSTIDIFFHGRCALWSKNLYFFGGKFPKLEEKLDKFWNTKCDLCDEPGASVEYEDSKFSHFICLDAQGYKFDADNCEIIPPKSNVDEFP